MPNTNFNITSTCANCGIVRESSLSKIEAVFELFNMDKLFGPSCKNCNSEIFHTAFEKPEIDMELMVEWVSNENLYFLDQDEELYLADELYFDLLISVIDNPEALKNKLAIIFSALCVLVYDNTAASNQNKNDILVRKVLSELIQRKDKLVLLENEIPPFLKRVVFRHLKLK